MANVTETEEFTTGVYQLEVDDFVEGGANGVDNLPHKHLANRTKWLKAQIVSLVSALGGKVDKVTGKALSANDFTDALKTKLDEIKGAEVFFSGNAQTVNTSGVEQGDTFIIMVRAGDDSQDNLASLFLHIPPFDFSNHFYYSTVALDNSQQKFFEVYFDDDHAEFGVISFTLNADLTYSFDKDDVGFKIQEIHRMVSV